MPKSTQSSDILALLREQSREMKVLRQELRKISAVINADIRTADRLISVREACAILGKKKTAVYEMIKSGELPARKEGSRNYRLSFNQVQKFIHT